MTIERLACDPFAVDRLERSSGKLSEPFVWINQLLADVVGLGHGLGLGNRERPEGISHSKASYESDQNQAIRACHRIMRLCRQSKTMAGRLRIGCAARRVKLWRLTLPAVVQGQFNYTTNNRTITITKYTGSGGAVTIPSTINGLPVTSIGDSAFGSAIRANRVRLTVVEGVVVAYFGLIASIFTTIARIGSKSGLVKNPLASFLGVVVAFPLVLSSGLWESLGAESSAPPPVTSQIEATNSQEVLQAYLKLQEQLQATQLAIEQNRQEAKETAAQNAGALAKGLQSMQEAFVAQRAQDLEAMQRSNRVMLIVAGTFAGMGFLTLLVLTCFQWRMSKGLAEISAALPTALGLGPGSAAAALAPAEQLYLPLFGAIEQPEERPHEPELNPHPAFKRRAGISRSIANRLFPARGDSFRRRQFRPLKVMRQPHRLLFICGQNRLRSLTAKAMYQGFPGYAVKSAGTEPNARIRVNKRHIRWADIIFVMENYHLQMLKAQFGEALQEKNVICLNIPDNYRYMERALIEELKAALTKHVEVPE